MDFGLLSLLISKKCSFSILVDSSASIDVETFNSVVICVCGLVSKLPQSFIQIINFSSTAEMVSHFKKDKVLLEEEINKGLKRLGGGTNLDIGLKLVQKKINLLANDSDHIVIIITDGDPSDIPTQTIKEMILNKIEFFGIGVGSVSKPKFQRLLPGQKVIVYESFRQLCETIEKITPSNIEIPFDYRIKSLNNKIQRSTDSLLLEFIITPSSNIGLFEPNTINIKILPNDYYLGFEVLVHRKVTMDSPFKANIKLNVKNNVQTNPLPECIFFEVYVRNEKYFGCFFVDFSWFSGDFKYTENVNIFYEGMMGNGKTSMINLTFNLFTSNLIIDNHFLTARSSNHVTTSVEFNPISAILDSKTRDENFLPIYQDIIDNIKIVVVDKPGMTSTDAQLSCYLASLGCYSPGTSIEYETDGKRDSLFECHSYIFVISLGTFASENQDKEIISKKIIECTEAKIQPVLAITFCDNFTKDQIESTKEKVFELPVEKENVFFITPYIDNELKRDPSKDLLGWRLLKRAFEIGKNTIEQRKTKISSSNYYTKLQQKKEQQQFQNQPQQPLKPLEQFQQFQPQPHFQQFQQSQQQFQKPLPPQPQYQPQQPQLQHQPHPLQTHEISFPNPISYASSTNVVPKMDESPSTNLLEKKDTIDSPSSILASTINSMANPIQLQSPILSPNSKTIKPWILAVSKGTKTLKFKVSPSITITDFIQQVSQKFGIQISDFNLEDSDGCVLSGISPINEVLEDLTSLSIADI
ncbi:hypothetical protein ACTA71_009273 [Dictyostelium dimigraforme]